MPTQAPITKGVCLPERCGKHSIWRLNNLFLWCYPWKVTFMQGSIKTSFQGSIHICESHQILGLLCNRQHKQCFTKTFTVTFNRFSSSKNSWGVIWVSVSGKCLKFLSFNTHTVVFKNTTAPLRGIWTSFPAKYAINWSSKNEWVTYCLSFLQLVRLSKSPRFVTDWTLK